MRDVMHGENMNKELRRYRITQMLGGLVMFSLALPLMGLGIFFLSQPPPSKAGAWTAHWMLPIAVFGLGMGFCYFGLISLKNALAVPDCSSPERIVEWFYRHLLSKLGSGEEFGPQWTLLASAIDEASEGTFSQNNSIKRLQTYWEDFHKRTLTELSLKANPKLSEDPLFINGGRYTTLYLAIERSEVASTNSNRAIIKSRLVASTADGKAYEHFILETEVSRKGEQWYISKNPSVVGKYFGA